MKNTDALSGSAVKLDSLGAYERGEDVYMEYSPDSLKLVKEKGNKIYCHSQNGFILQIDLVSDHIWRFRYVRQETFEEAKSYALNPSASFPRATCKVKEKKKKITISGKLLKAEVSTKDLRVSIYDVQDGCLLSEDQAPFYMRSTIHKGKVDVKISKTIQAEEVFFGLGDKSGNLNLKGQKLENWCTDAFGFGANTDPLYRSIPFYYGLTQGKAYGIFLHNTYKSHFDFGHSDSNTCAFSAEGGEMDYYFIYGPALMTVAQSYHELTGKPELPPLWALGFHQCRWSYYPESRVNELAEDFRKHQIPCDAIYLDIDYMDGYRCFTWNKDYFPKPAKMIKNLKKNGFHTVVMIDPGIRVDEDYPVFQSGIKEDVFCRRSTGDLMKGPVWPPECVFPDYTNPVARTWWAKQYKALYNKDGVSGFWNDMNEPAVFRVNSKTFPNEVQHDWDGYPTNHKKAHNIYGLLMTQATIEGLKALNPKKRPFLLARATFSGGQRYAALWTGDNFATWEHLRLANIQCQRLSISGFSFNGTDIGGFAEQPNGELFVRWLQLGAFHPLYRVHSMGNKESGDAAVDDESIKEAEALGRADQEPWAFGEPYTSQARAAIELRYRLLPYHYSAFWQHVQDGDPVIRSLSFYDQHDPIAVARENEFLYGDHLLVCPVLKENQKSMTIYLPKGQWVDYYTGKAYEGEQKHRLRLKADYIPLFAKAGSIIPNYPVQQYTSERNFSSAILRVYFGKTGNGFLYEDEGEGYTYQKGQYQVCTFDSVFENEVFAVSQRQKGKFKPSYKKYQIQLLGLPGDLVNCEVDGKLTAFEVDENGVVTLEVKTKFKEIRFCL